MHPALDDVSPSVSFDTLREEVKQSRKLRGIVVGRTGRISSMMGGRTLSSDPAYLAHIAGDDLSDSDDDQSVGGRSMLSSHGKRGGGWEGGQGDDAGEQQRVAKNKSCRCVAKPRFRSCNSFFPYTTILQLSTLLASLVAGSGLPFWGGEGEGGELIFDTSSDFFTAVAEVNNLQSKDITVWCDGREKEKEVIVSGGSSRIIVEVDRVDGVEDFVSLQVRSSESCGS